MKLDSTLACFCVFLVSLPAGAQEQICFSDSIAPQPTNFVNQSVTVAKFDPALGILSGIELTLEATVEGSAAIESLDSVPVTTLTSFQATLSLARPDGSMIVTTIPEAQFVDDLSAFDGIIDFRGTSGVTHAGIIASALKTVQSPPPSSNLALFTGTGTIQLPVAGIGTWYVSGPCGCVSQFMISASAEVTVCYLFELDCNANGIPDGEDIAGGTSEDCNGNGVPDECEVDPGMRYCFGVACPCGNDDSLAGCANSGGLGAALEGMGSASLAADDLLLLGSQLIPSQPALLFSADLALNGCAGTPFGDGRRCAGGSARRLATGLPDANGDASFGPGLLALEGNPLPGDVRRYQLWCRDPLGPCGQGFNLSNGFSVTYTP